MSSGASEYINLPASNDSTPLKLRNPAIDNLQNNNNNSKKRPPSTPLTPTLVQKNIIKKQLKNFPVSANSIAAKQDEVVVFEDGQSHQSQSLDDQLEQQENEENYLFTTHGSPRSKKHTPILQKRTSGSVTTTPKITAGIKQVVKEQKKSRLHLLKSSEQSVDRSFTESEYSEVSTISGDTPNYKLQENLVYYKNGYYINGNDDSFYEYEKENLVSQKELERVNDLLDFMKLEREYQREN